MDGEIYPVETFQRMLGLQYSLQKLADRLQQQQLEKDP
jgi:hypothetical protein